MNKKVPLSDEQVAISSGILCVYPAQLEPVPVPNQEPGGETESRGSIQCDSVFMVYLSRLNCSKELVAAAEDQIMFFVRVDI
jgi:hypothetical protein